MSNHHVSPSAVKRAGAGLGAIGLAAGLCVGLTAAPASAQSAPLDYTCDLGSSTTPPLGEQTLTVQLDTNAPKSAKSGKKFPVTKIDGTVTVPADVVEALADEGYTTIAGTTDVVIHTLPSGTEPGDKGTDKGTFPLAFEDVAIPQGGGPLEIEVGLELKKGKAYAYGTDELAFTAGKDLDIEATGTKAAGQQDGPTTTDCDLDNGQDSTIDTVRIISDDGGDGDKDKSDEGKKADDKDEDGANANVPTVIDAGA